MKKTFAFSLKLFLPAVFAFSLLLPHIASAGLYIPIKFFRRPLDTLLSPPFSSYYDDDTTAGIKDYKCESNTYNNHKGTDFRAKLSTPVYAAASGGVYQYVKNDCETWGFLGSKCGSGFGNHVRIDHEGNLTDGIGLSTIYAHLEKNMVAVSMGTNVNCSSYIGRSGSSGNSTGPHLHFEVRKEAYPANDPFAGKCGGSIPFWNSLYADIPSTTCLQPPLSLLIK